VVAFDELHAPTSTTSRSPAPRAEAGVTVRLVTVDACPDACCTKVGVVVAPDFPE
jgi:hypothetical protein